MPINGIDSKVTFRAAEWKAAGPASTKVIAHPAQRKAKGKVRDDVVLYQPRRVKTLGLNDRMGNFLIQKLMSDFNQAETLASSILKKKDDTTSAVIGKI